MDLFTPEYKKYKARRPPPDFGEVIDFNNIETKKPVHRFESIKLDKSNVTPVVGVKPCNEWNVYRFPDFPGFIVIKNPFIDGYQRYWVYRCLQDFSADQANSSNLTNLGHFDCYDIWEDFVSRQCSTLDKDDRLRKLRWVTLGYHYGWDVKEYSEDRRAEFPSDVQCLSQYFSHCLGFGPFRAEAGIVNYYYHDSALGGHTDHSEIDHTAPLLSFSFGQSCVFLLGGPTKETKPMAIFIDSGDVCIMSKEARLAYHAVPKILSSIEDPQITSCFTISKDCGTDTRNNGVSPNESCNERLSEGNPTLNDKQNGSSNDISKLHSNGHISSDGDSESVSNIESITNSCTDCGGDTKAEMSQEYVSNIDNLNANIEKVVSELEWKPFDTFIHHSRINLNLRQVLPPGYSAVAFGMAKYTTVED